MRMPLFLVSIFPVVLTALYAGEVCGQDYPAKPIRIITSAAGGGSDFSARQVAQGITAALGQPLIVDNRTALLATDAVTKSPPDGYTLLANGSSVWILPLLQKTPWDPLRDLAPIAQTSRDVKLLVTHPSLPVKSVRELIALAKTRPAELNYASGGIGTPNHFSAELFNSMAGVKTAHIPYKGGTVGFVALLGGEVHFMFASADQISTHVQTGRVRALAVTNLEPSPLFPGLPTMTASGVPGYEMTGMTGIWAPAKTPAGIITRLNQEIVRTLTTAEVKERYLKNREEATTGSPEQFAANINTDMNRTAKLIKDAGLKAN